MRILFFVSLSIFFGKTIYAQNEGNESIRPLILIDTLTTYNELMILNPSKMISIYTINPDKAVQIYGMPAKFGVIKIQTKPDIHFVRLNDILDNFNIDPKYRNLKVCIDQVIIQQPEKLLADLSEIKKVEITSAKKSTYPEQSGSTESYINIVTQTSL